MSNVSCWTLVSAAYHGGAEYTDLLSALLAETASLRAATKTILDNLAAARVAADHAEKQG